MRAIVLESFPLLTFRSHEGVSPTAVYIRIGDTLASCYRGNNTKDDSMVNYYAKKGESVTTTCHLLLCECW